MKRALYFSAVILILFTLSGCRGYFIPSGSMEETLKAGDYLFTRTIFYPEPERGDLVVFKVPKMKNQKEYIKRCIAIPGDKFEIKNNSVFINGIIINEPYTKGITTDNFREKEISGIVPESKFVVLGDNRENSMDSRYYGYVDFEDIRGKAFLLYWNTENIHDGDFSRLGFIE